MSVKIQNKFNKDTNSFDKNVFDIKETDKAIFGRLSLSKKDENEKWVSGSMGFVAFKKDLDQQSIAVLTKHTGESFNVTGEPMLGLTRDGKGYIQFNIKQARLVEKKVDKHNLDKSNGYQNQGDNDDEIPF